MFLSDITLNPQTRQCEKVWENKLFILFNDKQF